MGTRFSLGYEERNNPDVFPVTKYPPTFDPLAGFPKGRKKREMKVTEEEMDAWMLDTEQRDYCAHKYIEWIRCANIKAPLAGRYCGDYMHAFHHCELEDQIMRMKEFERERRLLQRMKRKRLAAENSDKDTRFQ